MCLATQQLSKQLLAYEKQVCSAHDFGFFSASALLKKSVNCVFWKCSGHLLYLVSCEGSCEFPQDVQGSWIVSENLKKRTGLEKTQNGKKSKLINL